MSTTPLYITTTHGSYRGKSAENVARREYEGHYDVRNNVILRKGRVVAAVLSVSTEGEVRS